MNYRNTQQLNSAPTLMIRAATGSNKSFDNSSESCNLVYVLLQKQHYLNLLCLAEAKMLTSAQKNFSAERFCDKKAQEEILKLSVKDTTP